MATVERHRTALLARRQALLRQLQKNEERLCRDSSQMAIVGSDITQCGGASSSLAYSPRGTRLALACEGDVILFHPSGHHNIEGVGACSTLKWLDEEALLLVTEGRAAVYGPDGALQSEVHSWTDQFHSFHIADTNTIILLFQADNRLLSRTFERSVSGWRLCSVIADLPPALTPLSSCPYGMHKNADCILVLDLSTGATVAEFQVEGGEGVVHVSRRADDCFALLLGDKRLTLLHTGRNAGQRAIMAIDLPCKDILSWCISGAAWMALTRESLLVVDLASFKLSIEAPHGIPNLPATAQLLAPERTITGHCAILANYRTYFCTLKH